jgi:hypothetical protein
MTHRKYHIFSSFYIKREGQLSRARRSKTSEVSAVRFFADGPRVEIYLVGEWGQGQKGGCSAEGEKAVRLWEFWCALSTDVLSREDPVSKHPRVKGGG